MKDVNVEDINVKEKILEIKKQIEQILFDVHNNYSLEILKDVSEIYDIFKFGETSKENEMEMEPFLKIYEEFIGLDDCYDVETEDILYEYQEIYKELDTLKNGGENV